MMQFMFYTSHATTDHFRSVTKMAELGSGVKHTDKP